MVKSQIAQIAQLTSNGKVILQRARAVAPRFYALLSIPPKDLHAFLIENAQKIARTSLPWADAM